MAELTDKTVPPKGRAVTRIARTGGGVVLLAVGAALLVLPGPGLVVIAAGLALLAVDHDWARRLLSRVRQRLRRSSAPR